jgi:predicted MPP superfamily phosphohydrolase
MIREANPDIIAITGDSFDSDHSDIIDSLNFFKEAMEIAQCYFVVGNNEGKIKKRSNSQYKEYEEKLIECGVIVLHNQSAVIERNGEKITVFGVDDPGYNKKFNKNLKKCDTSEGYTLLLSHRPERFSKYIEIGFDLVLTGHAHGGQFRLPFIGGIYAPQQGFFPKYTSGLHTSGETSMVVSRGLGHSSIPIRLNNRPELVVIELHSTK